MPFNPDNYELPPWTNGIMMLTHEECVYVIEKCNEVEAAYAPTTEEPIPSKNYIISNYNKINNWQKAINGDTYDVLQSYDPQFDKQGINANGIINAS